MGVVVSDIGPADGFALQMPLLTPVGDSHDGPDVGFGDGAPAGDRVGQEQDLFLREPAHFVPLLADLTWRAVCSLMLSVPSMWRVLGGFGMEKMGSISEAKCRLLAKIRELLSTAKRLIPAEVDSVGAGIRVLSALRGELYEDLNQIQHAALILDAAEWLDREVLKGKPAEWYWNPYQTGGSDEPDLQCRSKAGVIVAEATASPAPKGLLDSRMASTLEKMNRMAGERYYFVRTAAMRQRAETKIAKAGWNIQVIELQ